MEPLAQIRTIAERVAASRGLDVWDVQSRLLSIVCCIAFSHAGLPSRG